MKSIQKFGILSLLCVAGLFQANAAFAQTKTTLGAQVCMPMNLPLASTLQWRSEGLLNNNTVTHCSLPSGDPHRSR